MLKFALGAAAVATVAFITQLDGTSKAAEKIKPCSVHSRGEAVLWAHQNPGISYLTACKQSQG